MIKDLNTKICTKCKEEKPRTNDFFAVDKQKRDGWGSWCKSCVSNHGKGRTRKRRQQLNENLPELVYCVGVASRGIQCGRKLPWDNKNFKYSKAEGRSNTCRQCSREANRQWRKENTRTTAYRVVKSSKLKYNYGVTLDWYQSKIKEQNNLCELCGEPETQRHQSGSTRHLSVDHNHSTGKVRGVICSSCNIGLQAFDKPKGISLEEYLSRIFSYLKRDSGNG
jgi:Recombination endonuclease VII